MRGVSTRKVDKLVKPMGLDGSSKSRVSEMAKSLDEGVEAFRNRALDTGPYPFVWLDAMQIKNREGGRVVNVTAVMAIGVNSDGYREILGVDVITSEDGAGWLAFLRSLVSRGLSGVQLATSDAHEGLKGAIGATLPGSSWQRCRTHFMVNLLGKVPKAAQQPVATLVRSIFAQPDAASTPSSTTCSSILKLGSPTPPSCWRTPARSCWPSPPSRRRSGARSGRTTRSNASTRKFAAAPTWSVSSRTDRLSSAWSAPCSPSKTTSGLSLVAT